MLQINWLDLTDWREWSQKDMVVIRDETSSFPAQNQPDYE